MCVYSGADRDSVMVSRFSHRGLADWLIQRVTSLLVGTYAVGIFVYILKYQPISFSQWHTLFHYTAVKVITLIVIFSILWHAWIGLWTVFTDYVNNTRVRIALQTLVMILLITYLIWGFYILWMV